MTLATAATEVVWTRNLLNEIEQTSDEPVPVFEDNQSCIHLLNKWEHQRVKHIDVKYNFIRELVQKNVISVRYISTTNQKADILTKALSKVTFIKLRERLKLKL